MKGTQDSFLKEIAAKDQKDVSPRPKTRLSKLLSKSLSSEKSQSSAGKEDDRASDDPSTVLSTKQKICVKNSALHCGYVAKTAMPAARSTASVWPAASHHGGDPLGPLHLLLYDGRTELQFCPLNLSESAFSLHIATAIHILCSRDETGL